MRASARTDPQHRVPAAIAGVVDGAGVEVIDAEQLHGALDDRVQGPLCHPVEQPGVARGLGPRHASNRHP